MKENILIEYKQEKAIEMGIKVEELLFLDWFINFANSSKIEKKYIKAKEDMGFWLSYKKAVSDLPLIFGSSESGGVKKVQRLLAGNLSKILTRDKSRTSVGTKVFIVINKEALDYLKGNIDNNNNTSNYNVVAHNNVIINRTPTEQNCPVVLDTVVQRTSDNSVQRKLDNTVHGDNPINDKSIKYNSINIISRVIGHLNKKTNQKFNPSTKKTFKLLSELLNNGYTEDDFKRVIDSKVIQWLNNSVMNKYLRPDTLFGHKFENYVNEAYNQHNFQYINDNIDPSKFNNFPARNYDYVDLEKKLLGWV